MEAIAAEKAGIMRPGVPCVVAPKNDKVAWVFEQRAAELDCECRILGNENYACQGVYEKFVAFSYFSSYYGTIPVKLNTTALYQVENVCLALAGLEGLIEQGIVSEKEFSVTTISKALWETSWAGRMEEVLEGVILDGAHNIDGLESFLESIPGDMCEGQRIMIFSAVSDKDYGQMLEKIFQSRLFSCVIVTQIAGERGVRAECLFKEASVHLEKQKHMNSCSQKIECYCECVSDILDAVRLAFTKRKHSDYIYIVGSLYLVGQIKQLLNSHSEFSTERKEH